MDLSSNAMPNSGRERRGRGKQQCYESKYDLENKEEITPGLNLTMELKKGDYIEFPESDMDSEAFSKQW